MMNSQYNKPSQVTNNQPTFAPDILQHQINGGMKRGKVHGTHNEKELLGSAANHNLNLKLEVDNGAGIKRYGYLDKKGKRNVKTVYDPAVYTDAEIYANGVAAAVAGYQPGITHAFDSVAPNGLNYRICVNQAGVVTNFFPLL